MKTYNVPVEIEFMPAFEKACKRVGIMDIKIVGSAAGSRLVAVSTSKPENLFSLGNQYAFYKTMQIHNNNFATIK